MSRNRPTIRTTTSKHNEGDDNAAHASQTLLAAAAGLCARHSPPAWAQTEKPQYGGTLEIVTVYPTLSALSWDLADWNWKQNHDAGLFYEQLFAADLSKSKRKGGKHPFYADAWLPSDAIRGELAESWEWKDNPLRIEIKLRKGIMFPEQAGRDGGARAHRRGRGVQLQPPRQEPEEDRELFRSPRRRSQAPDPHTVVFEFKEFNAEWDYRFGWGYYSGVMPKEVADAGAGNWKNANGTGPFMLTDFVAGNSNTYVKNPNYWDKETIGGVAYKLPFVDKLVYRTIKDEATYITALRTAKIDILEIHPLAERRAAEEERAGAAVVALAQHVGHSSSRCGSTPSRSTTSACAARSTWRSTSRRSCRATTTAMPSCSPIRSTPTISATSSRSSRCRTRSRSCSPTIPTKAKQLLAEAGYPKGFSFKVQVCSCQPDHMELLPLVAAYLEQVGVKIEIQPMEYGAFLSAMTTQDQHARLLHEQRPHQPDHHDPQELRQGPGVEPVAVERSGLRAPRWTRSIARATRRSASS